MSRVLALLVSAVFVLTAFAGVVPVAYATAQALSVTDVLGRLGFEEISVQDGFIPQFGPVGLNREGSTLIMLKLPGDPVAVVQSYTPDTRLTPAQKDAIKSDLKSRQDALKPSIEALGGRVVGQYQVAYNGMKIEVPRARLGALAQMPGVIDMSLVRPMAPEHVTSLPLLAVPSVWGVPSAFHGEGIKIAVIDTGIDYTHKNFGGLGTPAAFAAADAADTLPADPAQFGPGAPKVKGGIDLVGDDYTGENETKPDPNPLDCNGHGSHVAGSAAGFGVTAAGGTFAGPYNAATFSSPFRIGPGVAPLADIYAVRVFGCTGFTTVTVDAIEWAVDNDMDVINMSLGSVFGLADSSSAEASDNAAKAGVIVVASAGNNSPSAYVTGAPAAGDRVISVAASDATATFPGATVALSTGGAITALNANGASLPAGSLPVAVLRTSYPSGPISLGCSPANYTDFPGGVGGKLVVTLRGVCARVARAIFGQQAGAAAVAMINTDAGFPPFEGQITRNPDTGVEFTVTIPFLGIRGVLGPPLTADGDNLVAADGGNALLTATTIANPGFKRFAGFTSGGPRSGDSALKPDITAPGVSIESTLVGSGNGALRISGTSMSAPHVAGVAALVKQAHPTWKVEEVKAAIVNTGSPAELLNYRTSRGGTGLVQPASATRTQSIAFFDRHLISASFGFRELSQDFVGKDTLRIRNLGTTSATFTLSAASTSGSSPHSVEFGSTTVTVPPGKTRDVKVTLRVPVTTVGDSFAFAGSGPGRGALREAVGLVKLTPTAGQNNDIALRVPYHLVPRALSDVKATLSDDFGPASPSGTVTLKNKKGPITGFGDFYAWGLKDRNEHLGEFDLRAVGVQTFPFDFTPLTPDEDPNDRLLVFAVNTYRKWSNAATNEFDIFLDVSGDGIPDFAVVGVDLGAVTAGQFDGRMAAFVFKLPLTEPPVFSVVFFADAPTDSSTVLLPVLSTQIGISPSNPRFSYSAVAFSLRDLSFDVVPGVAKFNAYTPAISNGQFIGVAKGATATTAVTINTAEWTVTPALGIMVVVLDNASGSSEARLLEVEEDDDDDDDD